jgi:hypothetical protein
MEDNYGWPADLTGLAYIGIGLGFLLGLVVVAKTGDATARRLTRKNGGRYEPEYRMTIMGYFACGIPISLCKFLLLRISAKRQSCMVGPSKLMCIGSYPLSFSYLLALR